MTLAQHHIDAARQKLELAAVHGDPVTLTGEEVRALIEELGDESSLQKEIRELEYELDDRDRLIDELEGDIEKLHDEIDELT